MTHIQWREINWQLHHEIMSILDGEAYGTVSVVFWLTRLRSHELVTCCDWFARFSLPDTSGPCPAASARVHAGGRVILRLWRYDGGMINQHISIYGRD